jgi:O-antigen/teichoic acid export membrane protein
MNLRTQLVFNTLSNGLKLVVIVGVGLLVPPLMIAHLGIEQYGTWALIVATSALIYVFDLGLQPALMKLVAEAHARGDMIQLSRDVNTVLANYLGFGVFSLLAGWLASPLLIKMYFQGHSSVASLKVLILVFIALSAMGAVVEVFQTVLSGVQRMDQANMISVVAMIVQVACLVIFLLIGWDLWGIAVSVFVGHSLKAGMAWMRLRRDLPGLVISAFYRPRLKDFRRILYLSSSGIVIRIGGTITGQLSKFLIGYFVSISWVTYYDLAARVISQFGGMASIMFAPLIPAVSQLSVRRDRDRINRLAEQSLLYMNLLALPFFWFLLIFAKGLVAGWLGPGFETVALTLQVLIVAHYINLLSGPAFHTLMGLGKPILGAWAAVINSALFCLGTLVGGFFFGYWGILAGEFIGVASGGLFLMTMFHWTESVPLWKSLWRTVFVPSSLTLASASCLALVQWKLGVDSLNQNLWVWAIELFMYWLMSIGLFRLVGILGSYEWSLVQGAFRCSSPANDTLTSGKLT